MDLTNKMILEVIGKDAVDDLTKKLDEQKAKLADLAAQFRTGAISQGQFDAASRTSAQEAIRLAEAINKVNGSGGKGGQGLLGASYAFQDFTSVMSGGGGLARALGSITNNFTGLASAAGASVETAAKLSFGFTAFTALLPIVIPMFKDMWDAMAGGGEGPEPVIKAMDAVEERLKRIRAEAEAMMKAMTSEEEETARNFREFLGKQESGMGRHVVGGLAQALAASGRGAQMNEAERAATSDDAIEAAVDATQRATPRPLSDAEKDQIRARGRQAQQAARDAAQKRINEANVDAAGKIFGAAPTERGARDTMRAMGAQFPGAFPKGFAGQMGELEPEAMRAQDRADAEAEAEGQSAIDAARRRRERVAENVRGQARMKKMQEDHRKELEKRRADERKAVADASSDAGKAAMKKVTGTDIDERAALELGGMRAQGGAADRFGRFHEMTPAQQDRRLQQMVDAEIKRRFPMMSAADRAGAARGVTRQASGQIQEQFNQARAEATDAGLDATAATQQATVEMLAAMQAAVRRANMLEQRAAMIEREVKSLRPQQQPLANNGHP
jgi:hypothetical protein